jgi:hypothetical protein
MSFAGVADVSSVYARDWPPKTGEPRPLPVRAPAWSLSIALLNESATCRENSDEAEMVPSDARRSGLVTSATVAWAHKAREPPWGRPGGSKLCFVSG